MVSENDLKELRKLPPKERLKRLEELKRREEQERRRRESEAKKIIEESLSEIRLDEMLREIDVPDEEVDVGKIFEQQAIDIEEQVRKEKIAIDASGGQDYGRRIQQLLPQNTLEEIQQWYAQDNRPPTREEFLEVYENAREAYEVLQQSMQAAPDQQLYSTPSDQLVENVVTSMQILRSMGYKKRWFEPGGAP